MANTKKKTAGPPPDATTSTNSPIPVRLRMYRQGLGDCFLLTFDPGNKEVHILIDCGSLGAKTTGVKLRDVVADISETTNNHIHLLIATHEHKDHVCAFYSLQPEFKKITVDNVWMAWTENPGDDLAQKIGGRKDLGFTLAEAARVLIKVSGADQQARKIGLAVHGILGFTGDVGSLSGSKFSETINEAMQFVRTGFKKAKTEYRKPGGAVLQPPWLPGFRFYVLGPPYSEDALQDTGEKGSSELYGIVSHLKTAISLKTGKHLGHDSVEEDLPFDSQYRLQQNGKAIANQFQTYLSRKNNWRRIDHDWLHCAEDLALQLDDLTNNTSLALAIERISDGKVFLFPADAQEGNWLSWHDKEMKWIIKDGDREREVDATDLLNRTVFYKVGHHASHNATAREKGLEQMLKEDELIAFIPVDRAVALTRNPKGSWKMPAKPLYRRLLEKCQGRVLRSDLGWADDAKNAKNRSVEEEFVGMADAATWSKWKQSQAKVSLGKKDSLYFEIEFR